MSNEFKAYELMGSILAQLPFKTALENHYSNRISDHEESILRDALRSAASTLMRARLYYKLDEEAVDACAEGFAFALTQIFVEARAVRGHPAVMGQVAGGDLWELVFVPSTEIDRQRTDSVGRVWQKLEIDADGNRV